MRRLHNNRGKTNKKIVLSVKPFAGGTKRHLLRHNDRMTNFEAAYIESYKTGRLSERITAGRRMLQPCIVCPHQCRAGRLDGQVGLCRTGAEALVCSYHPHRGEEKPLVGESGSGTIFFTYCSLLCSFCQNSLISHHGEGGETSAADLAAMMISLQQHGCPNINFVTPSHVVPQILEALAIAIERGLTIPLIYNSSGYDALQTLKLLDGVIDIYMPDFKFWDAQVAARLTNAPDYPEIARKAIKEMHDQVGDLVIDRRGIARRGLLVRHLVLPGGLAGTQDVMHFLAAEISLNTYVNIMDQYWPAGDLDKCAGLSRRITDNEYEEALQMARQAGLCRLEGGSNP